MAFKMKYRKGMGFPFKDDDKEEFVNTGENQPGVTPELHNALTAELEYPSHYTKEDIEFLKEQKEDVVREEDKSKKK